jgi:hypothetical protein
MDTLPIEINDYIRRLLPSQGEYNLVCRDWRYDMKTRIMYAETINKNFFKYATVELYELAKHKIVDCNHIEEAIDNRNFTLVNHIWQSMSSLDKQAEIYARMDLEQRRRHPMYRPMMDYYTTTNSIKRHMLSLCYNMLATQIAHKNYSMVVFLCEMGWPIDSSITQSAITHYNAQIFYYLVNIGVPINDQNLILQALFTCNYQLVPYLHEHGAPITPYMRQFVKENNIPQLIEYFENH